MSGPAEHGREHDGGRVDRKPDREPALHEEQEGRKLACFPVETRFEVLVRRVNLQAVIDGDDDGGEDHHRNRQTEVELHEAHPVLVGLAGSGEERDGTRLCGDDRQPDRPPPEIGAPANEAVHRLDPNAERTVANDGGDRRDENGPVERSHVNARVIAQRSAISTASTASTST